MSSLAVIRDIHLNPWDAGNYYGVISQGVDLYLCGRGPNVRWDEIKETCPGAKVIRYNDLWEPLELEPGVVDVPDAHYAFSQYYAGRHDRVVMVAWDNLPGKNSLNQAALTALGKAWKHVARSKLAYETLIWDGLHPHRIEIIPGAVDTEFFHPGDEPRENAVLFVGRLTLEKGLLDLIWAMKGLDAELWIVGEGDDRDYFQTWIDLAGIKHEWFGFLGRHALAEAYRCAKVLCVPSIPKLDKDPYACWLEQFGQVFVEAMASGLPVVSTQSGAIPEVIAGAGIAVPPRDFAALRRKLKLLLTKEKRWKTHSDAARSLAESKFGQGVVGRQIVDWYFGE